MNIVCHADNTGFAPYAERYYAYDADTYDGADDSGNRHQIGRGATRAEAVNDLIDILLKDGEITHDEAADFLEAVGISRYRDPDLAREDMAERAAMMQGWDE